MDTIKREMLLFYRNGQVKFTREPCPLNASYYRTVECGPVTRISDDWACQHNTPMTMNMWQKDFTFRCYIGQYAIFEEV